MSIALLGAVTPIHMVGESHSLVFSNLLFRPGGAQENYLCKTRFLPVLKAAEYSAGNDLSADYVHALIAEGIVDSSLRPAFLHAEPSAAFLAGMPVMAPPMVLFAGDLDMHQLFRQIGGSYDFILPDDPCYGTDKAKQILPYSDVEGHISGFLNPFFNAVRLLKSVGFSRMMIHCLPPRTPDNVAASHWTGGIIIDAAVRAKLTLIANRQIAAFCADAGIAFIDTWPDLTENGLLRPEFELDGAHINRQSALISLEKITAHLFDQTAGIWNSARYANAASQAEYNAPSLEYPAYEQQWRQSSLTSGNLGADFVEKARTALSFDIEGKNPHARPDWIGRPRGGCAGVTLAKPSDALLDEAAELLGHGEGLVMLQAGSKCELTVSCLGPVRYAAHAESIGALACPAEVRRAVILLTATDRIAFETVEGASIAPPAYIAGQMIVYDPHKVSMQVAPGSTDLDLIEITLIPRLPSQPFRVIAAGLCDFPADPFMFSATDMKASPQFRGPFFKQRSAV